ncbi:MAG: DUF3347 domain-containing protein [Chitinophagaceae bacterium]|nr:DUF3347 domain-containing protein [Flavisolibacter longurius]RYY48898.1 MAG: DUF3347 domain-containing protein [Chitinophagaceae bacterium]
MKQVIISLFAVIAFASCANDNKNGHSNHDTSKAAETTTEAPAEVKQIKPAFANLDGSVSSHIKEVFDHYIHVKTALVNSDPAEAKNGANAMLQVIKNFDKSLLPAEQKAAYDETIGSIRSTAGNIAANDDLEKQREHFAALSNEAYKLAKSFGAGKTVYHEHCPMALNDKGAMWLSETKEIKNPYYGEKMMTCGTVEEVIEK